MTTKHSIQDKLAEKSMPLPWSGCFVWLGYRWQNGYGRIYANGTMRLAHRVAYELERGPIPAGFVLSHQCREKSCINPLHLSAVKQIDNVRFDYALAPWGNQNTSKTHCPRGHEYDGTNLRIVRGKRYCRECVNAQKRDRRKA